MNSDLQNDELYGSLIFINDTVHKRLQFVKREIQAKTLCYDWPVIAIMSSSSPEVILGFFFYGVAQGKVM